MSAVPDTVVLFLGDSNYGNIGSMVPALAGGFEALGLTSVILDLRASGHERELARLAREERIAALVAVSGFGLPPGPGSSAVDVFNAMGVPVLGVFLDHPFCLRERIDLPLERYHASFPAGHAAAFCRRYIRSSENYHHLPHASTPCDPLPWEARDIDLLLTGSLFLPPAAQRAAWRDHGPDVEARLNDVVDLVRADYARPLEVSVRGVIGDDVGFEAIFPYMKTVDDYIRNVQRVDAVQALAPLRPTVVGPGWAAYADNLTSVNFIGETTIHEALDMTRRARAIVNPFPGYNDSHERVFNAMAVGTAVMTSRSAFYDQAFSRGEVLTLSNEAADMPQGVSQALMDDDRLRTMAMAGRQRLEEAHTWTHRAAALMKMAGMDRAVRE